MSTESLPPADRRPTDPSDFAWIEALFDRVVELAPAARQQALAEACQHRPDLQAELEALLAAHDRLASADTDGDDEGGRLPPAIAVGARVGAYRLIERIGEGGMGEVFRAERADGVFASEVAVKVTRSSLAGHDLLRRFQVERQILASLNHPNIVTLLDGGATSTGQAYLIMEYVDGVPVTQYCRAHSLRLDQRLRLFLAVCEGVHFAHQHAVVHRDLKPANVLVGADGVPKVVDFGIAKLLDDPTGTGVTTVGITPGPLTPNYASPEQLRGLPVTTSTDLYALGVILYELVAGVRPYDTQGQTLDRMLEIVLHTEPPRPSASTADDSSPLPYERTRLRGDIDAIVLKAMHKDPAHRYTSAAELARDITRYLEGDPILARSPSTGYVLRRLAARHKALVAVTSLAVVAIVAALGAALWQRQVARREQLRAEQRFLEVRHLANSLIFKIHDAVLPLAGSTPVRRTIVNEALGYLERLAAESSNDVTLRLELAAAYRQLGAILGAPQEANLGDRAGALRLYERAREMLVPLVNRKADYDVFAALVSADNTLATLYLQKGGSDHAIRVAREAVDSAGLFRASHPQDPRGPSLVARASFTLAFILPPAEARPVWEETLRLYEHELSLHPSDPEAPRNVALVGKYLGAILETAGDFPAARAHYDRSLQLDEQRLRAAPTDPRVRFDAAISFSNLASTTEQLGDLDTAAALFERSLALRRSLVAADPLNVQARNRLAYLLARLASFNLKRNLVTALAYGKEAIEVQQQVLDKTGDRRARSDLGFAWLQVGLVQERTGAHSAACSAFQKAVKLYEGGSEVMGTSDQAAQAAEMARGCAARPPF